MTSVAIYLAAVVAANLTITLFGPRAAVLVAFLFIGATLTVRDRLHDRYGPRYALVLVALGAMLSAMLGAGRVAMASGIAFLAAEGSDTLVYHLLRRRPWLERANASNLIGAAVDSLVFPVLAFGAWLWPIIVGQFIAKTLGGALWAWALQRLRLVAPAAALALVLLATSRNADAQSATQQQVAVRAAPSGPPTLVIAAQAGGAFYPWREFDPVPQVGLSAHLFLPHRLQLNLVATRDLEKGTKNVYFLTLGFKLWSR